MELYQLKSLIAVAEEGNLRLAAERLFASQPAVSGHIKALEDELGVVIFDRTRHGMILTPDGERIHTIAERMLAQMRELESAARSMREEIAGTLRIGIINDGRDLRLDEVAGLLAQSCPGLQLIFDSGSSGAVLKGLRNEELDIGYIELQPTEGDVSLMQLMYNEPVIVYPKKWASDLKGEDWAALLAKPWAFVSEDCSHCKIMLEAVAKRGLQLDWRYRGDHESLAVNMVSGGMAVSLISREIAEPLVAEGKIEIWPYFSPKIPRSMAYLTRRGKERAIQAYIQAVTEVMLVKTARVS